VIRRRIKQLRPVFDLSNRIAATGSIPEATDAVAARRLSVGVATLTGSFFLLVTAAALIVWVLIAVAHVDDNYLITHVSGTRMALARYFDHGVLYPPIYDGNHFGGTRIMPLPIVLHGSVAKLTGDYLMSGKLVSYISLAALLVVVFVILRRLRCSLPVALLLTASLLVIEPGYRAAFAMLGDALPVTLGLLALLTAVEGRSRGGVVVAAALSGLALIAKLSALWAPLAIGVWLFAADRRRLPAFLATYVVLVAALMAAFSIASSNRFFDNVIGLSLAGVGGLGAAIDAPSHLVRIMFFNTPVLWGLVPIAILAVGISGVRRNLSIYDLAFVCHIPLLLILFADIGADANHLFDLEVLGVLAIGRAASYGASNESEKEMGSHAARAWLLTVPQALVGLLFVWVTATQVIVLAPDVHTALASLRGGSVSDNRPLEGWIDPEDSILSEDPYIPVALDQTPVVADPFMLPRIGERDPEAVLALVRRIEAKEFDFVVLSFPLERDWWWERFHFGSDVMEAVRRTYEFSARTEGYYLYEPSP